MNTIALAPEKLEYHPFSIEYGHSLSPDDKRFQNMEASMVNDGQQEPIVLFERMILDGRKRYEICLKHGLTPWCINFEDNFRGKDPVSWIIAKNIARDHMTEAELIIYLSKPQVIKRFRLPGAPNGARGKATSRAAAAHGVSARTLERALHVREHGTPELVEAMEQQEVSIGGAAELADKPPREQRQAVGEGQKPKKKRVAKVWTKAERRKSYEKNLMAWMRDIDGVGWYKKRLPQNLVKATSADSTWEDLITALKLEGRNI